MLIMLEYLKRGRRVRQTHMQRQRDRDIET